MHTWQCDCGYWNQLPDNACCHCGHPRRQREQPPGRHCAACGRPFTSLGEDSVEVEIAAGLAHQHCARRLGLQPFRIVQALKPITPGRLEWGGPVFEVWAASPRDAVEAIMIHCGDSIAPGQMLDYRVMDESGDTIRASVYLAMNLYHK